MKVKVLGQNVLLRWPEFVEATQGGIVLPENQQKMLKKETFTVVAVGEGIEPVKRKGGPSTMPVKEGDEVLIPGYARGPEPGHPAHPQGALAGHVLVELEDILAVVEA